MVDKLHTHDKAMSITQKELKKYINELINNKLFDSKFDLISFTKKYKKRVSKEIYENDNKKNSIFIYFNGKICILYTQLIYDI